MLPEALKEDAVARAVEEFDSTALVGGNRDRGEVTLEIAPEEIVHVCRFLKTEQQFERLSTLTGVDHYPLEPRFEVVYHLHSITCNLRLRLKCRLPGDHPHIDSITSVWRAANWYERETFDLFGVQFLGHPDLRRIMLPDEWEGHPLRKDYPVTGPRV
jgi:NADH-quinone oxidoreductase subunit C